MHSYVHLSTFIGCLWMHFTMTNDSVEHISTGSVINRYGVLQFQSHPSPLSVWL